MRQIQFTRRDCQPGQLAVIIQPGTVLMGYIETVSDCKQCGGICFQYKRRSGRVTHHEKLHEAKDEAKKL